MYSIRKIPVFFRNTDGMMLLQRTFLSGRTSKSVFQQRRQLLTTGTTTNLKSSPSTPFPTWTFENCCDNMERNRISNVAIQVSSSSSSKESSTTKYDDADLILLGIHTRKTTNQDNNNCCKIKNTPILNGIAKAINETVGGAIQDFLIENSQMFEKGTVAICPPTLRVVSSGKVSLPFHFLLCYPVHTIFAKLLK